jgi:hypothetical protein
MSAGERIDWGGDNSPVKGSKSSSFSSLLGRNKSPKSNKNNNKFTGFVVKNGGGVGQKTITGLNGLKKTLVDRKVNLKSGSTKVGPKAGGGAGTLRTQWVAKDGGTPSKAVVQSKPVSVKVRAERPVR